MSEGPTLDKGNAFSVCRKGDKIYVMELQRRRTFLSTWPLEITRIEAVNLAAWLVAVSEAAAEFEMLHYKIKFEFDRLGTNIPEKPCTHRRTRGGKTALMKKPTTTKWPA